MRWRLLSLPAAGLAAVAAAVAGSLGLVAAAHADEARIGYGRPSTPASRQSREAGHELEDMSARVVGKVLGIIFVSYALAIGGIFFMVHHLGSADRQANARFTREQMAPEPMPQPQTQAEPVRDYLAYRRHQLDRLYHYERLGGGYARIPIDRAMAIELGHGLDAPVDAGAAQNGSPAGADKAGGGKPAPQPGGKG